MKRSRERDDMERNGVTRRNFLKIGGAAAASAPPGLLGGSEEASAKTGTFATLIDLTKCDGCATEPMPKCVEACRRVNAGKFPEPKEPIRDLWPQKTHDDWSSKRGIIDRLTPYNWTTVQRVRVDGEDVFIPRRCMHCDNPPCANLCPFGALNKYEDSSVVINPDLCLGGAKCKAVCPWGIPQRQSGVGTYLKLQPMPAGGGVMYKCDLCHDRLQKGWFPPARRPAGTVWERERPCSSGPVGDPNMARTPGEGDWRIYLWGEGKRGDRHPLCQQGPL